MARSGRGDQPSGKLVRLAHCHATGGRGAMGNDKRLLGTSVHPCRLACLLQRTTARSDSPKAPPTTAAFALARRRRHQSSWRNSRRDRSQGRLGVSRGTLAAKQIWVLRRSREADHCRHRIGETATTSKFHDHWRNWRCSFPRPCMPASVQVPPEPGRCHTNIRGLPRCRLRCGLVLPAYTAMTGTAL